MHIVIVHNSIIPAVKYGGIERVIWYLGEELAKRGHVVTYLVKKGSSCAFANVISYDFKQPITNQIPNDADFVHVNFHVNEKIEYPHLITVHGNLPKETVFNENTSFVSANHAKRYGASAFVYNGMNWDDYGKPSLNACKNYVHFLGKAAWRLKNVRGAIKIADANKTQIKVLGGNRINIKMGPRITLSPRARFYGMVGGKQKNELIKYSKGLVFPVLWHEPMGLALIESLYFGCPVLATKYGAIPEIISKEFGILSNAMPELIEGFQHLECFNRKICNEYATDIFNSKVMTDNYLKLYEMILNGERINNGRPGFVEAENILEPFLD
jgi:glycosyltransferase involved in cell wall biosynthesis